MWWLRSKKTVAVHDGNFHADDVFAVAVLSLYFNGAIRIIRTRDSEKLKRADYVLDVGCEYDPARNRFDHHQEYLVRENKAPYASFGLIWKKIGEEIGGSADGQRIVDEKLVQPIDAVDNAIDLDGKILAGVKDYSVSDYIEYRNAICQSNYDRNQIFKKLVLFASEIIQMEVILARRMVQNKSLIADIYNSTKDKRIIVLDGELDGWNEILTDYSEPLLVVKPMTEKNLWKISCVKIKGEKFKSRRPLPEIWAGKIDTDLIKVTGLADAVYCHHQRFMAITKTKAGAIKLAELALQTL